MSPKTTSDQTTERNNVRHRLKQHLDERQKILDLVTGEAHEVDPISVTTAASTRRTIDQIEIALDRLATGTYGTCASCGHRIPKARLEVLPYATTCMDCQRRQ